MTLTRPAWHATLTNHTRGWTYETYQGEDRDPDAPVWLLDNWTTQWAHRDNEQWAHLDPSTVTVRLAALDVDDLPLVDYDDEMSLEVVRPLAVGDPIVWFHAFGGVSDLDAAVDFRTDAQLTLTFVDPRAVLGARTHVPTADPFEWNAGMGRIRNAHGGLVVPFWGPMVDVRVVEGATYADAIDWYSEVYNYPDGWSTWRIAHRPDVADLLPTAYLYGPETPYYWYYDFWPVPVLAAGDGMPALFELGVDAGMLTVTGFEPDVMPDPMTVIPASAVRSPVPWKKDASNGEVAIDGIGIDLVSNEEIVAFSGPPRTSTKTTRVEFRTLFYQVADLQAACDHQRELRSASKDWRTPSMTVDTSLLTDDQVDYLAAGRLYPRQLPYDLERGMSPVVVVGAAHQSNLAGALIVGLPVAAAFNLIGGRLLIDVNLSAWDIRDSGDPADIPGPPYADLDAAFPTIDYAHIDPSLTYQDLKLAAI